MSARGEREPLLNSHKQSSALPYGQLAIICYARWVDSCFFFTIFPYIAQMIQETGVAEERIGFYSGVIESIYSFVSCITLLFFWTKISDRYGRKPVMLICLVGITVAGILFGFATEIWQMIACRALAGAFSGCVGTLGVMISEITDSSNRPQALSIYAFAGSISALVAPIGGGMLARPADNYDIFRGVRIFERFPYLLPSLLMCLVGTIGAIASLCFLNETRSFNRSQDSAKRVPSMREVYASPGVSRVLIDSLWASSMGFAWMAIQPLFCYTNVKIGGLGFTVRQISLVLGTCAILQACTCLLAFPWLYKRVGLVRCLITIACGYAASTALAPIASILRRCEHNAAFECAFALFILAASIQSMFSTAMQLAVVNVSPSPQALATINSLALAYNMAGRTVAPATGSSLYALGVDKGILGGHLAWVTLFVLAVGFGISLHWFPKEATGQKVAAEVETQDS